MRYGVDFSLSKISSPESSFLLSLVTEDAERGNGREVLVSLPYFENAAINCPFLIGIVDNAKTQAETREFFRWLFTEADWKADLANEESPLFPTVTEECRGYLNTQREWIRDPADLKLRMSAETVLWNALSSADHYIYCDEDILAVIEEEAFRYFSGAITAEKAAEYIQNRVSIYLAEQG